MQGNKLMLVIAAVAGLAAAAIGFLFMQNQASRSASDTAQEPMAEVLVARADLSANSLLEPERDLTTQRIPARTFAALVSRAVKPTEKAIIAGARLGSPVPAGSPLLYSHMAPIADIVIPPEMRAITLQATEIEIIGGLLMPGDFVDVVVSTPVESPVADSAGAPQAGANPEDAINSLFSRIIAQSTSARRWQAAVMLENVRVLAVGDRLSGSRRQMQAELGGEFAQLRETASTVTIEATVQQCLRLIEATSGGEERIRFLLRSGPPESTIRIEGSFGTVE